MTYEVHIEKKQLFFVSVFVLEYCDSRGTKISILLKFRVRVSWVTKVLLLRT